MNSDQLNKKISSFSGDPVYPVHGGNPDEVCKQFGMDPENLIDFSASINPFGPPDGLLAVLKYTDHNLAKYPDPEYTQLRGNLSGYLNIPPSQVVVGNGSTELIHHLPKLWDKEKEVVLVSPGFSEYERAFSLNGISIRKLQLDPKNKFQLEIDSILFQLSSWKNLGGIVIGHPNSPAGCLMKSESLLTLLQYCEKRELFLVVDETFIEFCDPRLSLLRNVKQSKFLILIRSFTKFFALPALRLGYCILTERNAQNLKQFLPPWSVNSIAEQAGLCALADKEFMESSRKKVSLERNLLHERLSSFKDLQVFPSGVNFILFQLANNDISPDWLYTQLVKDGILLRNCWNFDGLDKRFFRVGIRSRADNNKLIKCLFKHLT